MPRQVASAWKKVVKLSVPNDFKPFGFLRKAAETVAPASVTRLVFGAPAREAEASAGSAAA